MIDPLTEALRTALETAALARANASNIEILRAEVAGLQSQLVDLRKALRGEKS